MGLLETIFGTFIDILLHLDLHLKAIIEIYHFWTYAILFLVIFCETGLIFAPFLPGDSLLFTAGAFAALGSLQIALVFATIFMAAVLGDLVNYSAGKYLGPKMFNKEKSFLFKKEYLVHTEKFYQKHGSKTIIAARFMPIVRTFAPFIAGIGRMSGFKFLFYNIIGALLWCSFFILGGYFFGNIPIVKEHFSLAILAIIIISFLPAVKEIVSAYLRKRQQKKQPPQ